MAGGKGKMSGTGWHIETNYYSLPHKDTTLKSINAELKVVTKRYPYAIYQFASNCKYFNQDYCNKYNGLIRCKCLVNNTTFCDKFESIVFERPKKTTVKVAHLKWTYNAKNK